MLVTERSPVLRLHPHPNHPPGARLFLRAALSRMRDDAEPVGESGRLVVSFRLYGDVSTVVWYNRSAEGRTDDLWRHGCFELFAACGEATGYTELNLAPAARWAAYAFDDHRAGGRDDPEAEVTRMLFLRRELPIPRYEMSAMVRLPTRFIGEPWLIGLSSVIEEMDGTKSYWALAHPPGPPDFHHPACFTAALPPPPGA